MLEHVPAWLGSLLKGVRAGADKLVILQPDLAITDARIDLSSPAFADGARLPVRFTGDGEGVSPPLVWGEPPAGTAGFALLVEDADAPAPSPLVHALVWGLPADERRLAEGAIARDGHGGPDGRDVGRNSFLGEGWLPPDPPTGHGVHVYAFQLFALAEVPAIGANPGRGELIRAMAGRVLAAGLLRGTYDRGEAESIGRARTAAAPLGTLAAQQ
ncbi:YbhB/YbcL family Raf kinase inhibitor-like protein [Sphingomonas nostoxanthinifaciens]|uniref:YbhB/YbcL family Raf kinase inhibitor-like protein n=1 Tax=Sphingomonas nostoxanthinifaciens TaxID=2872652 RepID=UPI001CC1CA67|nr:YbhB/YbcL family Raf kinase inhibitor-like protein [Sphingomonas nostoxanthinifaciens]UAK25176.1 YbhB/YbcL family Raf kinase inhibitor-like protein [Sphingomonas nostoxanthinifaciens]